MDMSETLSLINVEQARQQQVKSDVMSHSEKWALESVHFPSLNAQFKARLQQLPVGYVCLFFTFFHRCVKALCGLTGVHVSLSGELSGEGGSTTMLVTLQE